MKQFSEPSSWAAVVLVAVLAATRVYLLFGKRQRMLRRVEVARAANLKAGGVPFKELPSWERISRAARMTALVPGGATALILAAMLLGGRNQTSDGVPIDLLELAVLYFAGSVFLGAAIGFGAPYMRGFVRASIVGIVAIAPLTAACGHSIAGGHWRSIETVVTAVLAVVFGMSIGYGTTRSERVPIVRSRSMRR